jgi:MYXO-CTERM domain-containing protein
MSALRVYASALLTLGLVTLGATTARADDCPLGSVEKTERGATWCEPTVCDADMECATGLVCRKVALCVDIGTLDKGVAKPDAAQRLIARQRCGAEQACPQNTTCSEKGRCVTRAQADKAALVAPGAAPSASAGAGPSGDKADAPKKACGCRAVGASGGERAGSALALFGLAMVAARRARRADRD